MRQPTKGYGFRAGIPSDIAGAYTQPPSADNLQPIPRQVPVYLPELFPIPDAVEFNPVGSKATVAAETSINIPLLPNIAAGALKLPDQNIGVIRSVTFYVTNMLTTTDLKFTLLVGGAPAGGYGSIPIFPRASAFVGNTFDCFIRVSDGASIAVVYTNTDGGSYIVGASVSGWYWPKASGDRWLTQGV